MISKTTKVLLGGLIAGTLLTGVGAGVATAEYTAFEVDCISPVANEESTIEEITYEMVPGELIQIVNKKCNVVFDETVAEGTVRMEVEYYPELSYINYWTDTYLYNGGDRYEEGQKITLVYLYTYDLDSAYLLLEYKDEILQGLKENTLLVFDDTFNGDNSIKTVKINPADENRLIDEPIREGEWTYLYG